MQLYQPTITGSLLVSGSVNISGSLTMIGGTLSGTASLASTASSADNFTVRNTLTAQTLVVQTITSSVDFVTGSTRFGSLAANTHTFTGSMFVTGALYVTTGSIGIGTTNPVGTLEIFKASTPYLRIIDGTRYVNVGVDGTSVFYNTNSSHRFYVQDGTITAMTVSSSGNVGIGTSSPSRRLTVPSDGSNWISGVFGGAGGSDVVVVGNLYGPTIGGHNSTLTAWAPLLLNPDGGRVGINTTSTLAGGSLCINGNLDFGGTAGGNYRITNYQAGFLAFGTDNTERMRITSGGSVCINRTSGGGELNVQGTIYLYLTTAGAGNSTLKYNTSTGVVSYDTSARIFKKDIIDLEYGLDAVLKMSSKKYKWKSNNQEDLGFIADEMYQVVPEVVYLADSSINETELENGEPMGINYDRLVPVLVKAIQEQQQQINELKALLNK